ncbi:MAG: DUF4157 domain-containing protein [Coleofasciculus sp. C2-GNP5-27]
MVYDHQSKSSSWTPTPRKSSFFPSSHIQTKTEATKGSELVGTLPSKAQRDKIRRSLFGDIPQMTGAKAETAPTEAKEVENPTQMSEEATSGEIQAKAETGLNQSQGYGVPSREVRNKIRRSLFGNLEQTPVQKQEEGTSPPTPLQGEGSMDDAGGEEKGLAETEITLPIQAKLTIGEPNDKYEQEADRVARQVVDKIHSPTPETVQRQEMGDEDEVRLKSEAGSGGTVEAGVGVTGVRKSRMEGAFGADFSGVRVHTDAKSDELNQAIQAKAFTTGEDIFFRDGAYQPGSRGGQELLAHELTHVVQQKARGEVQEEEREKAKNKNREKTRIVEENHISTNFEHQKIIRTQLDENGIKPEKILACIQDKWQQRRITEDKLSIALYNLDFIEKNPLYIWKVISLKNDEIIDYLIFDIQDWKAYDPFYVDPPNRKDVIEAKKLATWIYVDNYNQEAAAREYDQLRSATGLEYANLIGLMPPALTALDETSIGTEELKTGLTVASFLVNVAAILATIYEIVTTESGDKEEEISKIIPRVNRLLNISAGLTGVIGALTELGEVNTLSAVCYALQDLTAILQTFIERGGTNIPYPSYKEIIYHVVRAATILSTVALPKPWNLIPSLIGPMISALLLSEARYEEGKAKQKKETAKESTPYERVLDMV